MRRVVIGIATRVAAILGLLGLLGIAYLFLIRPAQLRWGASAEEVALPMPEDAIVAHPVFDATRAITIGATPEQIWPWLIQMGFRRAGFYGYDLIENLGNGVGVRSATTIVPAFQHPKIGESLPISVAANLVFGSINPNEWVVWRSPERPCHGVFIWELVPLDANHTRLISRIRWSYVPGAKGFALGLFTEFADHVAVRKILKGIRDRAEGRAPEPLALEALEVAGWFAGFFAFCAGLVFITLWRRWQVAWAIGLGAGVLLLFVLYSDAPWWICAPLPWLYLAGMVRLWLRERKTVQRVSETTEARMA